jgi:hypothetical protein
MLGVTIFGIFFTPVFYVVIRWFTGGTKTAPKPVPQPDHAEVVAAVAATIDGSSASKHGIITGPPADISEPEA